MAESYALGGPLSPLIGGKAAGYMAIRTVYGGTSQGRSMAEYLADGYTMREALMLSEMNATGEALANMTTLSHLTDMMSGWGALFNKGLVRVGGVKNPNVVRTFMQRVGAFVKSAGGEILEEVVKDPLLEGTYSDLLVGMTKDAIADKREGKAGGMIPALKHLAAGVSTAIEGIPETIETAIDEAPATALATLPFALLGAGGEVVRNSRSAKAARTYLDNPTQANADAFEAAVIEDAQDEKFAAAVAEEMRNAEIETETTANMLFDPEPALYDKAQKTREQADSHKEQMEASRTRIEEGWAAYDEGEASGNVNDQLQALDTIAKGRQGLDEHTREYEQKSMEAREASRKLTQEARDRAVATVNTRRKQQSDRAAERAAQAAADTEAKKAALDKELDDVAEAQIKAEEEGDEALAADLGARFDELLKERIALDPDEDAAQAGGIGPESAPEAADGKCPTGRRTRQRAKQRPTRPTRSRRRERRRLSAWRPPSARQGQRPT